MSGPSPFFQVTKVKFDASPKACPDFHLIPVNQRVSTERHSLLSTHWRLPGESLACVNRRPSLLKWTTSRTPLHTRCWRGPRFIIHVGVNEIYKDCHSLLAGRPNSPGTLEDGGMISDRTIQILTIHPSDFVPCYLLKGVESTPPQKSACGCLVPLYHCQKVEATTMSLTR